MKTDNTARKTTLSARVFRPETNPEATPTDTTRRPAPVADRLYDSPTDRALQRVLPLVWLAAILSNPALADPAQAQLHLDAAETYLAQDRPKAARIEFMNAVKAAPEQAEPRRRLGELYLTLGEPEAAEKELATAAARLGDKATRVRLPWARALALQGKREEALARLGDPSALNRKERPEAALLQGALLSSLERHGEAREAFGRALAWRPSMSTAHLGMARTWAAERAWEQAYGALRQAMAGMPDSALPWGLLGEMELRRGRAAQALKALDRAIEIAPEAPGPRLRRALALLGQDELRTAKRDLAVARRRLGDHPRVLTLQAIAKALQGDHLAAQDLLQQVLGRFPDDRPAAGALALVQLELGADEQALARLRILHRERPELEFATRAYGIALLRVGRFAAGRALVEPLLQRNPENAALLRAMIAALEGRREADRAAPYRQRLAALDDSRQRLHDLSAALIDSADNGPDRLAELEVLTRQEATPLAADRLLVRETLQRGDPSAALAAAERLTAKRPQDAGAAFLQGLAARAAGQPDAAARAFERAWALAPGAPPVAAEMARLALERKRPERAREVLERARTLNPGDRGILKALARLAGLQGDRRAQEEVLTEALRFHPADPAARLALGRLLLARGAKDEALALVPETGAPAATADEAVTRWTLRMLAGDFAGAAAAAERATVLEPDASIAWLRLAEARGRAGDTPALRRSLHEALRRPADRTLSGDALVRLVALSGDRAAQERTIELLADSQADEPRVVELRGQWLLHTGQTEAAREHYAEALKRRPDDSVWVLRLARTEQALGRPNEALAILAEGVSAFPRAPALRIALGDRLAALERPDEARRHYENVLTAQSDHAPALDRLARLLAQSDPQQALAYAQAASATAPGAERFHTLGILHLNHDRYQAAAQSFRACLRHDPSHLNGRYHLALALSRAGRAEAARDLLAPLVEQDRPFSMRPAAERLIAALETH